MKKVMHVISSLGVGGAETVLLRMVLRDTKGEHIVVSMLDDGEYRARLTEAGIAVYSLGMSRGGFEPLMALKLFRLIRLLKPDVIQTWMYHADLLGGVVGRLAGVKNVYWNIRSAVITQIMPLSTRFAIRLGKLLSSYVPRAVVVNSEHACTVHRRLGYSGKKMVTIPNGIPMDRFCFDISARLKLRKKLGLSDDFVALGMIARYDVFKDHRNLIRSLKLLILDGLEFTVLLAGKGMESTNKQLVKLLREFEVEDRVYLLGPISNVSAVLSAIDIHVLSSAGESFPNVVVEAMACGVPCVATDVGDVRQVMGDTGWVVPPADAEKLASAIKEASAAFQDRDCWRRRKLKVRERVLNHYSLDVMLTSFWRLWGGAG
jgi:glycosyltransferase involved in cell wall biosynthesis